MKKLSWKKVGCLLLAMLMMATMLATGVVAYDNAADKTGSITIHKYAQVDPGSGETFPTGQNATGEEIEDTSGLGEALPGVEFTIWNVTNIVSDASTAEPADVDVSELESTKQTTNDNGVAEFENLVIGLYLVKETTSPDKVTQPSSPFFVSIPMTNPNGTDWIYNVHVYPKNAYVLGSVELTKVQEDGITPLSGATFTLLKWDDETKAYVTTNRTATSDTNGKVSLDNLIVGKYALQEIQAPKGYTLRDDLFTFEITRDQQNYTFQTAVTNYEQLTDNAIVKDNSGTEGPRYIKWTVTADIPGDIDLYKQFSIKDEVPAGLAAAENIVVKVGDNELTSGTDYTLTNGLGENDAANDFNIAFTSPFTALKGADKVTIIFKTQIKEGANVGNVLNKATLTFQSKTDENPTSYSDDAKGAIYGIQVEKVNLKGNQLAGAKFDLYYGEDAPDTTADTPVYQDYTTGEDGTITFKGLNPGTYWLVETEAPNGYAKMTKAFKVEIKGTEENHLAEVTVLNTASFSLPITGGSGTLIFTFSGIALMGAAALLYIRSRRKKATEI